MRRLGWLAGIMGLVAAVSLAVRRTLQRARRENDRYADIDQAVREARTEEARLEATLGKSNITIF